MGGALFFNAPTLSKPLTLGSTSGGMTGGSSLSSGNFGGSSAWDTMTNAEKAAYYAENPIMASMTQFAQKAFGLTSLGALQRAMQPGFVSDQSLIAMGVNPAAYQSAKESFRASEIADMNAASEAAQTEANRQAAQESFRAGEIAQQNADAQAAATQSISDQNTGGDGGGYGGYSDGGGSDSFGEGQYNMGGLVDRVFGPNPPGPDEGAGYLQRGEYVIKKSAVDKYGQGLLDMINEGKIPTGAIPTGNPVLAKTWDAVSAQRAKMLEDIGADPKTIWQQTGTWKGPDGKWRQEVMR
jgi:hypothetical protein